MKVAFLKFGELSSPAIHVKKLLNYLRENGVEVREYDVSPENINKTIEEIEKFNPLFLMDVNATGLIVGEKEGKKVIYADITGRVHISLFFEDPLLFFPAFENLEKPRNYVALITDLKHTDSLRALGIENVSYITPFINEDIFPEPEGEKDIEIAFVGPVINPQIIANAISQNYPQNILPFFFETGEFMFRNPEVHVLSAFNYVFGLFHPQMQEEFNKWRENNKSAFFRLLNDISAYATMRKKIYVLNFLSGMDVKILGDYQGELFEGHEAIKVGSYEDLLKYYSRSKLTIFLSPSSIPTGISFIPLEIAYMDSVPVIEYKGTTPAFFKPDEEIVTFFPLDRADLEEKVVFYLENPDAVEEIKKKQKEVIRQKFTVKDRGDFLIGIMKDIENQFRQAMEKGNIN